MDADSNGGEWDYEEVKLLKNIYIYLYNDSTNTMQNNSSMFTEFSVVSYII